MRCPDEFVAFAGRLAEASGPVIRRYFRTPIGVEDKADSSPVTIADREAELAVRALIDRAYPDHGIIGEEHGVSRPGASHQWVIDPIDGTKAFITGKPMFGTLVALLRDGIPILGMIDQPVAQERWLGAAGHATTFNGAPASVRSCPELAKAVVNSSHPDMFRKPPAERFWRVASTSKLTLWGGDCYAYGLLAIGHIDLVIEFGLKLYDFAALVPIVRGAGGAMTDWQGKPLTGASQGDVIAAGDARTHREALDRLAA
ncbi:MAG: histidinol-phosphatase [Alphaproteobacteria bacterium]|nr:histidinol-phosphatase [Alphaproteobacteria bacterium]